MSLSTFYGGRPGQDFVIKEKFSSVAAMKESFSKNENYTDVWYGEYCLITDSNLNNPDNGKLYQRGVEGSIYKGQICGPQSEAPQVDLYNSSDITSNIDGDSYVVFRDENGELQRGYWKTLEAKPSAQTLTVGDGLVSGKDAKGIKYEWISVGQSKTSEEPATTLRLKATIPYPYFEATAKSISAQKEAEANITSSEEHPFSHTLAIKVPRGIRGDQLADFRIVDKDDGSTEYYSFNAKGEVVEKGTLKGKTFFAATLTDYSTSDAGVKKHIYIGDYDKIESASVNVNDGILTFKQANGKNQAVSGSINFIKETREINHHLQVLFTDKNFDTATNDRVKWVDEDNNEWVDGQSSGNKWLDLGSIKDTSGLIINRNVTVETGVNVPEYLKTQHGNNDGKAIAVSVTGSDKKEVYAYDYDTEGWFSLGALGNGVLYGNDGSDFTTLLAGEAGMVHREVTLNQYSVFSSLLKAAGISEA